MSISARLDRRLDRRRQFCPASDTIGDLTMCGLLKSTVFGAALLTGVALAAQAQSVSVSPPARGAPQQLAQAHPFGPKPNGSNTWRQQRYQPPADYATNLAAHPYSEPGRIGPKPN
jgi:hypothetical protein